MTQGNFCTCQGKTCTFAATSPFCQRDLPTASSTHRVGTFLPHRLDGMLACATHDPTGSNSYTAISIPFGLLAGTPASGSSLGSQSIIGPLLLFTSTADSIVVNMTTPTCSSFSYAYALSASQLY
ncbi:MAG: hypothetical protein P4K98_14020 [Bryobacteraceae bacterium]|nr:hypothetical protein [Bryobacteraceae bacterium]